MNKKHKGFTLIEVMIALMIASITIVALLKSNSQVANNILYFKNKTLANIVASNLAIETRLSERPAIGIKDDKYKMAGVVWKYRKHTTKTLNDNIRKTVITVHKSDNTSRDINTKISVYLNTKQ